MAVKFPCGVRVAHCGAKSCPSLRRVRRAACRVGHVALPLNCSAVFFLMAPSTEKSHVVAGVILWVPIYVMTIHCLPSTSLVFALPEWVRIHGLTSVMRSRVTYIIAFPLSIPRPSRHVLWTDRVAGLKYAVGAHLLHVETATRHHYPSLQAIDPNRFDRAALTETLNVAVFPTRAQVSSDSYPAEYGSDVPLHGHQLCCSLK